MENKSLKVIRKNKNITQAEACKFLNISLRSYKTYENDESKVNTNKYDYLCKLLEQYDFIDEEHGVLTIQQIKEKSAIVFEKYDINFCYLFGSYCKNKANDTSDIDLLIDTSLTGLDFYGLVEELRDTLHKKIDLLKINQLEDNPDLLKDILKEGIKIYG